MNRDTRANLKMQEPPVTTDDSATLERRILILAPTGNDAQLTAGFLALAGLLPQICHSVNDLCNEVGRGCGAILLAEEILGQSSIPDLVQTTGEAAVLVGRPHHPHHQRGRSQPDSGLATPRRFWIGGQRDSIGKAVPTGHAHQHAGSRFTCAAAPIYEARDSVEKLKHAHDEMQAASRAKGCFSGGFVT